MATPTETEVQTQWSNSTMLIEKLWQTGRTAAGNIIGRQDTLIQSLESDFAPSIASQSQSVRNSLANIIGQAGNVIIPNLQSYMKHVYSYYNLTDVDDMADELYDRFILTGKRIKSRVFSFGAPVINTVDYDCSVKPDAATPVWVLTGTDESSVANDILTIDTALAGGAAATRYDRAGLAFDNTKGWAVEIMMKVTTSAVSDVRLHVHVDDGTFFENLYFSTAQIELANDDSVYVMDTTDDFHVYRITGKGSVIKVYVDGILRITGTLASGTGGNQIRFGDSNTAGGANSKSEWKYVRYYDDNIRTGNGTLIRLNKDREDFDIENQHADVKLMKCINDVASGATKWEEEFTFEGEDAGIDDLDRIGSGLIKTIRAKSARNSLLLNPSFSGFSGATIASLTGITSWLSNQTIGSAVYYEISEDEYYRDFEGDTTPRSLKMKQASILSQKLSVRRTALDPKRPYILQLAWKRDTAADGDLTVTLGDQTVTVAVNEQVGWQILRIAVDTNSWPKNFDTIDTEVKIQWAPDATDAIFVDDVLLVPMDEFDGSWYSLLPFSPKPIPYLRDDRFTLTDTETGSINQYWFFRAFNKYLPHATGGGITWADPT